MTGHLVRNAILDEPQDIVRRVRSMRDRPRHCVTEPATLVDLRVKVARHIKNSYLKRVDAPVG